MDLQPTTLLGLKIVLALGAGFALFWFLRARPGRGAGPGMAERFQALGDEYRLFSDVLVPTPYGMSRIDHVIASPFGIFVVTVKKLEGRVEGLEAEKEWRVKAGGKWDTLYNPQWENRKLMNHLEAHLGDYPYIPVVVFTRARLKGAYAENVLAAGRLLHFIRSRGREVIGAEALAAVIEKLSRPSGGSSAPGKASQV